MAGMGAQLSVGVDGAVANLSAQVPMTVSSRGRPTSPEEPKSAKAEH